MAFQLNKDTAAGYLADLVRRREEGVKKGYDVSHIDKEYRRVYDKFYGGSNAPVVVSGGGSSSSKSTSKSSSSSGSRSAEDYYKEQAREIQRLYDQQLEAQLSRLRAERDKQIGALRQEQQNIRPQYQAARDQADVENARALQALKEAMAAQGLAQSGENVSGQVALNAARGSAINALNLQEAQNIADINRRISDLRNSNDEAALTSAIEAERARALLEARNRAEEVAFREQQAALQNALAEAGVTGLYQGAPTLAAQQFQFSRDEALKDRAWQQGNFANAYELQRALQALETASQKELMGYEYGNRANLARLEASLRPKYSGGGGGYNLTRTDIKNANLATIYDAIDRQIRQYRERGYGNVGLERVLAALMQDRSTLLNSGLSMSDFNALIRYAYQAAGQTPPK